MWVRKGLSEDMALDRDLNEMNARLAAVGKESVPVRRSSQHRNPEVGEFELLERQRGQHAGSTRSEAIKIKR